MRLAISLLGLLSAAAFAAPPPLEAFFEGAQLRSVNISPDGKRISMIVESEGKLFIAVKDRTNSQPAVPVLAPDGKDGFTPSWCRWANDERLVCSFRGIERDKYLGKAFPITRLVAVNHDGSQQKKLLQNAMLPSGQLNDRVIDWTPDDPRTVLIEQYHPRVGLRVLKLDIYNGNARPYETPHENIGRFGTDGRGNVRLGWGRFDLKTYYYARLAGENKWRRLARVNSLSSDEAFEPVAVIPGTNYAWATRDHQGRRALWKIDLADKEEPLLVFASSRVDVSPVYTPDRQVLAVLPDSGSTDAYYVDERSQLMGEVLGRLFKGSQYWVLDMSADRKTVVVLTERDDKAPEYHLLDMASQQPRLLRVGSRFPALDKYELAKTEYLTYPARDGTPIPAYLTRPVAAGSAPPPLIVLPHGGPWARDGWGFDSWVQMLARDGFAVLQMNYRGSAGYGTEWREASLQGWGGMPYTDTMDGLRWAVEKKHGDARRVCVVGGSFGGYLAMLAAARDSGLLKCVISVAGVSDLRELKSDSNFFSNSRIVKEMIGSDPEKLKADSPRLHADKVAVPMLLIHGVDDWTVELDQSEFMARAMESANKPCKLIKIDTDHFFQTQSAQRQLFAPISEFLREQLK
jgi:dipeptidyl aminopeptidase/acylaminoacyl peptidase